MCTVCWFITSEKGKSPENKGKNLLPTGRQKKAVYFRGALVSLASVGGRHCPRQGFLFSARVHEVNRFFLSATKKKRNTEKREKGKAKRKLEKKEKKGNLVEEKKPEWHRKLFAKHKFNEQCRPLEMIIAPYTHHVKRFFLFREYCTFFPMAP